MWWGAFHIKASWPVILKHKRDTDSQEWTTQLAPIFTHADKKPVRKFFLKQRAFFKPSNTANLFTICQKTLCTLCKPDIQRKVACFSTNTVWKPIFWNSASISAVNLNNAKWTSSISIVSQKQFTESDQFFPILLEQNILLCCNLKHTQFFNVRFYYPERIWFKVALEPHHQNQSTCL